MHTYVCAYMHVFEHGGLRYCVRQKQRKPISIKQLPFVAGLANFKTHPYIFQPSMQFYWTTHTHRAGISSPLCSFYSCCPYFISNADATTGSHYFERLLQITIRKLNSSPYTLQEEQTTLQELGKEDRYGYL